MKRCLLFLSFALILAGIAIAARSSRANDAKLVLSGTVYDTNHSVVASSEVVAQSLEGREYRTTATDDGVYKFELPPATYRIEANAPGFCRKRIDLFRVRGSVQGPLDLVLEVESDRPCAQKAMIKKEQPRRKPELFRSIAE